MKDYTILDIPRPVWNSSMTQQEIYDSMHAFAVQFISIYSNFTILEEKSGLFGKYGGIVYIGIKGNNTPVLAIANAWDYSSYWYDGFAISLLREEDGLPASGYRFSSFNQILDRYVSIYCDDETDPIRIYYKQFNNVFSFYVSTDYNRTDSKTSYIKPNIADWFISDITNSKDDTKYSTEVFHIYSGKLYFSPFDILGNVTETALFSGNKVEGRYYMMEIGISGTLGGYLKDVKCFSGLKTTNNYPYTFLFDGVTYQTLGETNSSYWQPCIQEVL